jgi:hypothetical protein
MKRFFLFALLALVFVLPVVAEDAPAAAPAADAPVAAPAADPVAAPAAVKIEGTIVMKDKDAFLKTADAEMALLPCEKLTELLAVEKVAEKTFVLEGEKVAANDGKSEGFMIKSFEEKKADAAPDAAPATEEKK